MIIQTRNQSSSILIHGNAGSKTLEYVIPTDQNGKKDRGKVFVVYVCLHSFLLMRFYPKAIYARRNRIQHSLRLKLLVFFFSAIQFRSHVQMGEVWVFQELPISWAIHTHTPISRVFTERGKKKRKEKKETTH